MTIADVLSSDLDLGLTDAELVRDALLPDPRSGRGAVLPRAYNFLLPLIEEAERRPIGFRGGWVVWSDTVWAVRRLLRDPAYHQAWYDLERPIELVHAIHLVGVFAWAPPIARQICPGRTPSTETISKAYDVSKGSMPGASYAIEFWKNLDARGIDDMFIMDGERPIFPSPERPELTCEKCGALNSRTPTGRLPRRTLCGPCKKKKENEAWAKKDGDHARRLWRKASKTYRQSRKSDELGG